MNLIRRIAPGVLLTVLALTPEMASACTACMGDPNTNIAKGTNAAIFLMLGVLGGMFGLLGSFAYSLYRRSKAPTPPHAELDGFDPQAAEGSTG